MENTTQIRSAKTKSATQIKSASNSYLNKSILTYLTDGTCAQFLALCEATAECLSILDTQAKRCMLGQGNEQRQMPCAQKQRGTAPSTVLAAVAAQALTACRALCKYPFLQPPSCWRRRCNPPCRCLVKGTQFR